MKEFKGKPGPWHWEGKVLCNDDHIVGGDGWMFNDADKKLIAAAPELLEALQSLIKDYDEFRVRTGRANNPQNKMIINANQQSKKHWEKNNETYRLTG